MIAGKIAYSVSLLFNESLATGRLPEQYNMTSLHPLIKPGNTSPTLASNYLGILSKNSGKSFCTDKYKITR